MTSTNPTLQRVRDEMFHRYDDASTRVSQLETERGTYEHVSMTLARALSALTDLQNINPTLAKQLRPALTSCALELDRALGDHVRKVADAIEEADKAEAVCRRHGVPCFADEVETPAAPRIMQISGHTAGRVAL